MRFLYDYMKRNDQIPRMHTIFDKRVKFRIFFYLTMTEVSLGVYFATGSFRINGLSLLAHNTAF